MKVLIMVCITTGKNISDIGHLAPEMIQFIPGKDSPIKAPLLLVTNEFSGQVIIYLLPDDGTVVSPPPPQRKRPPPPRRRKVPPPHRKRPNGRSPSKKQG